MTDNPTYKPRLGIDIRVKPPKGKAKRRQTEDDAVCAWPGCREKGHHRATVGEGEGENKYQLLCLDHVREFNQSWNYFKDMDDEAIKSYVKDDRSTGHRPTWKFGNETVRIQPDPARKLKEEKSERAAAYYRAYQRLNGFRDPFSLFQADAQPVRPQAARQRPKLNKIQRTAIETLDLPETATMGDIKTRYKELVKRLHPDTNGGDTSTVERLRLVIKAYNTLKASNIS